MTAPDDALVNDGSVNDDGSVNNDASAVGALQAKAPAPKAPAPKASAPKAHKSAPTRADLEESLHDFENQVRAANDKINKRTGRPIALAIIFGLILGGSLLVSLLIFKEFFMLFGFALIVIAALEFATALRVVGRDVPRVPIVIATIAIVPASFYGFDDAAGLTRESGHWIVAIAAVVFVSLWRLVEASLPSRRVSRAALVRDLGSGAFVVLYVLFLGSFFVLLTAHDGGQWWTLAALIIVVSVDTGAYVSGLLFGKRKMVPSISPNKTWEGFIGSVIVAIVAGVLTAMLMLNQPWWVGVIMGIVLALTGTVGDLTESLIKRDLGIKDISTWLPGHGGMLDRLDSILPSAAVAYALFIIFSGAQ
jgi:phosphatidate cytidylyltransferase